jgi:hypothetical protein
MFLFSHYLSSLGLLLLYCNSQTPSQIFEPLHTQLSCHCIPQVQALLLPLFPCSPSPTQSTRTFPRYQARCKNLPPAVNLQDILESTLVSRRMPRRGSLPRGTRSHSAYCVIGHESSTRAYGERRRSARSWANYSPLSAPQAGSSSAPPAFYDGYF